MNIYNIIKWYRRINSPRLKLLGILALHLTRRRYLYFALDPSLSCNFRCLMCFFSNPENEKYMHGTFSDEDIQQIAKAVFHRTLKLQIGCSAEPTTYQNLAQLVKIAHNHKVPYISLTTNGNLLTRKLLQQLAENGLDEVIVSAHGLDQETYEHMMRHGRFDKFLQLIANVGEVRKQYPSLKMRINFTICQENIQSLKHFPKVFDSVKPDTVQFRPVQDIGSSAYNNYSIEKLEETFAGIIQPLISYCEQHNITCLYPELQNMNIIAKENEEKQHVNSVFEMLPYFYMSPHQEWRKKFDPYNETFEGFCKRTNRVRTILNGLINPYHETERDNMTKSLNYTIK